jgi:AcrR family transcriptional regulator
MVRNAERARAAILEAALQLLRRSGGLTVDQVADAARCAKGLVHYHFHTKGALLAAAASQLAERRRARWGEAFRADTPDAAIQRSWDLLVSESRDGTLRAWLALCAERDEVTGQTVSSEVDAFSDAIAKAAEILVRDLGLTPTVSPQELGLLLAAVVHGSGLQLAAGVPPARLQGAYAAAWLGVLSLTRRTVG